MPSHRYVEERLGCHVCCQEVGNYSTSGIFATFTHLQVQIRLPTLALKPRGDINRIPKQDYHWPHKKDLFFLKNDLFTEHIQVGHG